MPTFEDIFIVPIETMTASVFAGAKDITGAPDEIPPPPPPSGNGEPEPTTWEPPVGYNVRNVDGSYVRAWQAGIDQRTPAGRGIRSNISTYFYFIRDVQVLTQGGLQAFRADILAVLLGQLSDESNAPWLQSGPIPTIPQDCPLTIYGDNQNGTFTSLGNHTVKYMGVSEDLPHLASRVIRTNVFGTGPWIIRDADDPGGFLLGFEPSDAFDGYGKFRIFLGHDVEFDETLFPYQP